METLNTKMKMCTIIEIMAFKQQELKASAPIFQ